MGRNAKRSPSQSDYRLRRGRVEGPCGYTFRLGYTLGYSHPFDLGRPRGTRTRNPRIKSPYIWYDWGMANRREPHDSAISDIAGRAMSRLGVATVVATVGDYG